jgi:hypothetical protein
MTKQEKQMSDAPCHYNAAEASAWANGYNECLAAQADVPGGQPQSPRSPEEAEIYAWIESIGRITPEIRQRILDLVERLDKCRDSRPLVYALSHNDPITVGDLRSIAIAISDTRPDRKCK